MIRAALLGKRRITITLYLNTENCSEDWWMSGTKGFRKRESRLCYETAANQADLFTPSAERQV